MANPLLKIFDFFVVLYRILINNRKTMIATMGGLVISLAIISTSLILVDSFRYEFVEELFLSNRDKIRGDIHVELYPNPDSGELSWIRNCTYYEQLILDSFEKTDYHDYLLKQRWYYNYNLGLRKINLLYTYSDFTLKALDKQYLDQIISDTEFKGRLPQNNTEIIYIYKENIQNVSLGTQLTISGPDSQFYSYSTNVTVVGVMDFNTAEVTLLEYLFLNNFHSDFLLLTYQKYALEIMERIIRNIDFLIVSHVFGKIYIDYKQIDVYNLNHEHKKFSKLLSEISNLLAPDKNYNNVNDVYGLVKQFKDTNNKMQLLQNLLLLIDLPMIGIAFFLTSLSFNLVKRQKMESIGVMKTRGSSWMQIFLILLGEIIIFITISTILALILGYILSFFLLRSQGFLDFSGEPIFVVINPIHMFTVFILALVIIILLNIPDIIFYSRMSITESVQPVEKKEPFWKRYYLDVIATLIGIAGYLIITELGQFVASGEENPIVPLLFLLLGVPSPFLLFFGSILLIARIFPFLANKLSDILWKRRGKLGAYSLRNMIRHKNEANRAVILITLALSYCIISASLSFSIDETNRFRYYYDTGADMNIEIDYLDESVLEYLKYNVSGIHNISFALFGHTRSVQRQQYYAFCFVDPETYSETAFFDQKIFGSSSSLRTLMERISDNKSVILLKRNLTTHIPKLKLNDTISFNLYNLTHQERVNYTIIGSIEYWPQYYKPSSFPEDTIFAVGSLGMFFSLNNREYIQAITKVNFLIDFEPDVNFDEIIESINSVNISYPTNFAMLEYSYYLRSVERTFGLSILNSALMMCMIIVALGTVIFGIFTYYEREKEIGIERALGMTRNQTAFTFMIENLCILIFGLSMGLVVGLFNTTIFLFITQTGRTYPRLFVAYPIEFIICFLLLVIIIAIIGTFIIAIKATKKDISKVLKVE